MAGEGSEERGRGGGRTKLTVPDLLYDLLSVLGVDVVDDYLGSQTRKEESVSGKEREEERKRIVVSFVRGGGQVELRRRERTTDTLPIPEPAPVTITT